MSRGISIVIPTFERTDLLLETIRSVQEQSASDWECLIVDDGSAAQHLRAIEQITAVDPRMKLIQRTGPSKGTPVCRNLGFHAAKFELVMFLDSDDLLSSDSIRLRLEASEKYPDEDFWVFPTLTFERSPEDRNVLLNVPTIEDPIQRFLKMDVMWLSSGPLWKKSSLEQLGGWDESLASWQDWDLSIRALKHGLSHRMFADVDNYFRVQNPERESIGLVSFTPEHLQSHLRLADKTCRLFEDHPAYRHSAAYLYFWIAHQWILQGRTKQALTVWKRSCTHMSQSQYWVNKAALLMLAVPVLRRPLCNLLDRRNHPAFRYWKGTFKRVCAAPSVGAR